MKLLREITAAEENFRLEELAPRMSFVRRDFVEPVPVGSYVAIVFKVTGYGRDCDGSALARLVHVDKDGEESGWTENNIGLYPDSEVVLDSPGELHALAARETTPGVPEK